jgi:hypothetical protein
MVEIIGVIRNCWDSSKLLGWFEIIRMGAHVGAPLRVHSTINQRVNQTSMKMVIQPSTNVNIQSLINVYM